MLTRLFRENFSRTEKIILLVILIAGGIFLVSRSVYRASKMPMTYDECISVRIIRGDTVQAHTANNHLLNSWCMAAEAKIFGTKHTLPLRLHVILAQIIWIVFGFFLLLRLRHVVLIAAGFVLLNFYPFIDDFFFIARGYGLALALGMCACWALGSALEKTLTRGKAGFLLIAVTAGAMAVTANLTFFPVQIGLLLIAGLLWLPELKKQYRTLPFWIMSALIFLPQIVWMLQLKAFGEILAAKHELYFGGDNGFIQDTIYSCFASGFYNWYYGDWVHDAGHYTALFFLLLAIAGAVMDAWKREVTMTHVLLLLGLTYCAIVIGLHHWRGVLYPMARGALPVYFLFVLMALYGIASLLRERGKIFRYGIFIFPVLVALILLRHFILTWEPASCMDWAGDKNNVNVLQKIADDAKARGQNDPIHFDCSWIYEPSLRFHAEEQFTGTFAPLPSVPSDARFRDSSTRYFYAWLNDTAQLPKQPYDTLLKYDDIGSMLLRKK